MGAVVSSIHRYASRIAFQPKRSSYDATHKRVKHISSTYDSCKHIAIMEYGIAPTNQICILYVHGNHCDIGETNKWLEKLSLDINCYIVSFDYPGYGLSSGATSAKDTINTITDVYNYLLTQRGFKPTEIVLYGVSLGTGPCCELALRYTVKGCLLQSPFTSAIAVGLSSVDASTNISDMTSSVSSSLFDLSPNFFVNLSAVKQIEAPMVILHGKYDTVVNYSHAKKLVAAREHAEKPIRLVTLETATHSNIETDNYESIVRSLRRLIDPAFF